MFPGDWQRFVQNQVVDVLSAIFSPDTNPVTLRFVRHSPGRRRNAEITMYDVCCSTKEMADLARSSFVKFRRRENPVPRPPLLKDVNLFPLVNDVFIR